jgi:hypothetical protein
MEFHRRRRGLRPAGEYPNRIVPVDAEGSREVVAGRMMEISEARLGL